MTKGYHEPYEKLSPRARELQRALQSTMEELEAAEWYQERVDVTENEELKQILAHNRDEEYEHAAMLIEWLRRNEPALGEQLQSYLFTKKPIVEVEEDEEED